MTNPLDTMIGAYLEGTARLKRAVVGMFPEHLTARPVPGKWSTLEVVCHLADFEPILAERMKRIIAFDRPLLFGADPDPFVTKLAYQDRDPREELAVVELTRKQMARVLAAQPPGVLKRQGVHSERGLVTLEDVLSGAIHHVSHHVAFIIEKREALGLPT